LINSCKTRWRSFYLILNSYYFKILKINLRIPDVNIAFEIDDGLSAWILKPFENSFCLGVLGDVPLLSDLGDKFEGLVDSNCEKGFGEFDFSSVLFGVLL
jgi:hypothetical protein